MGTKNLSYHFVFLKKILHGIFSLAVLKSVLLKVNSLAKFGARKEIRNKYSNFSGRLDFIHEK